MKKFLLFLILFGIISCSTDSDNLTNNSLAAETFLNVSYGNNPQQKYDLYLPADRSSEKTKVLVLIHGGGWTEGDKSDMDYLIPYIKQQHPNHAIVNINYVLADVQTPAFPNQFLDLDAVINKLTNEKNESHILPQFGLIGASAGAHISLMYDYAYDSDNQVKMVCDIVGPTDFTDPFYAENPLFDLLLASLVDESAYPIGTNFAEILSPAKIVTNKISPTILFYGNTDPLVPLTNGEKLNTALNLAGIEHNFTVYQGGHGNWIPADIEDLKTQISAFINLYLKIE